jgi:anti-anti-sigma factor
MQAIQAREQHTEIAVLEQTHNLFVRLGGDITISNSVVVHDEINAAWDERSDLKAVIVDLWEAHHLDSSGVGVLLGLACHAKRCGLSLRLCHLHESPRRLLNRTGLARLFEIYASAGEANT